MPPCSIHGSQWHWDFPARRQAAFTVATDIGISTHAAKQYSNLLAADAVRCHIKFSPMKIHACNASFWWDCKQSGSNCCTRECSWVLTGAYLFQLNVTNEFSQNAGKAQACGWRLEQGPGLTPGLKVQSTINQFYWCKRARWPISLQILLPYGE